MKRCGDLRALATTTALALALAACETVPVAPAGDGGPPPGVPCATDVECDDGLFCTGAERCVPDGAGEPRCVSIDPPCPGSPRCDEAAMRCGPTCAAVADYDGDGSVAIACGGDDCDDGDAARHPGAIEICDALGRDEDCDPTTVGARDRDRDGVVDAACCNGALCGTDCDDLARTVHPRSTEVCNELDDDCDGAVDEGVALEGFVDADFDGVGGTTPATRCPGRPGISLRGDDCDDADPSRHPLQPELCDVLDNDCDGTVDEDASPFFTEIVWYEDADGDGFGDPGGRTMVSCAPLAPPFVLRGTDCDDADAAVHPGAEERCNGRDDDCNGRADRAVAPGDFEDDDGDGVLDARCGGAEPDCDDRDASAGPGFVELCEGLDNDCDGEIDEGARPIAWFVDGDGDGHGSAAGGGVISCAPVPGFAPSDDDCDDGHEGRRPRALEVCDGRDDDCDTRVDEGCSGARAGFVDVAPGGEHTCAIVEDLVGRASIACWGRNDRGQLGDGTLASHAEPRTLPSSSCFADGEPARVFSGPSYSCVIDDAENQCCWGQNDHAQIGDVMDFGWAPPYDDRTRPTLGTTSAERVEIATGDRHACALSRSTTPMRPIVKSCWGVNDDGQLGVGGAVAAGSGQPITSPDEEAYGSEIASGASHTCATLADGAAICWGLNDHGQLGQGHTTGTRERVRVGLADVVDLAAGGDHTCALLGDGAVWCWGANDRGQLGDGTTIDRSAPVRVPGLAGAVEIRAGRGHTCARIATASYCWGANDRGQLGDGSFDDRHAPARIALPFPAIRLGAGQHHTCAIDRAGELWCFGANDHGQLGDLTRTDQPRPTRVVSR